MFKKGQAAMEFLMTYGWAILVVLVAIGALAYFGVLSPDKFLPSKCTLPSGIACLDHTVSATQIQVVLRNGLGYDMGTVLVSAKGCGAPQSESDIANGADSGTITLTCTNSGTKYNGFLAIQYNNADTGLTHVHNGSIVSSIS